MRNIIQKIPQNSLIEEGERDFDGFSRQDTLTLINDQGNSLSFKKKQTLKRKLDDIQYYWIDLKIIDQ